MTISLLNNEHPKFLRILRHTELIILVKAWPQIILLEWPQGLAPEIPGEGFAHTP